MAVAAAVNDLGPLEGVYLVIQSASVDVRTDCVEKGGGHCEQCRWTFRGPSFLIKAKTRKKEGGKDTHNPEFRI